MLPMLPTDKKASLFSRLRLQKRLQHLPLSCSAVCMLLIRIRKRIQSFVTRLVMKGLAIPLVQHGKSCLNCCDRGSHLEVVPLLEKGHGVEHVQFATKAAIGRLDAEIFQLLLVQTLHGGKDGNLNRHVD